LVKKERLQKTMALQNQLTQQQGEKFLGQEVEVLIEGKSNRKDTHFKGRNPQYWNVHFNGGDDGALKPGDLVKVKVEEILSHTLKGKAIVDKVQSSSLDPQYDRQRTTSAGNMHPE
jgi:tRNA-2-methylthio-N6-dimethylallyladenosine synthase